MSPVIDSLAQQISSITTFLEGRAREINPEIRRANLGEGIKPFIQATLDNAANLSQTLLQPSDPESTTTLWDKYTAATQALSEAKSSDIAPLTFTLVNFEGLTFTENIPFHELVMTGPDTIIMANVEKDPKPLQYKLINPAKINPGQRNNMIKTLRTLEMSSAPESTRQLLSTLEGDTTSPIWLKINEDGSWDYLSPSLELALSSAIIDKAKPLLAGRGNIPEVIQQVISSMDLHKRMSSETVLENINKSFTDWTHDNTLSTRPAD